MKTKIWILAIIVLFGISLSMLYGQANKPLNLEVIPGPTFYNVLRISSFDFKNPQNQPTFFTVRATNLRDEDVKEPHLHFKLRFNQYEIITEGTNAKYKGVISKNRPLNFTNRDIFKDDDLHLFTNPGITVSDIIDNIPYLRDTILNTGLFPDGRYHFEAQFKDATGKELSNRDSFFFEVRNPGGLFLISPGVALGQRVVSISSNPLSFRWSSNLAGTDNKFHLIVKEFEDDTYLTPTFIESGGNKILEKQGLNDTFYSEFLDLKDGRYYAWQVSTELLDPTQRAASEIKSRFNVFRFRKDADTAEDELVVKEIEFFLMSLNILEIMDLLNSGFVPTGVIEYKGREYSFEEIQLLLQELANRDIVNVKILD